MEKYLKKIWYCGTDSESYWMKLNYVNESENENKYLLEEGCLTGDMCEYYNTIDDVYLVIYDRLKHYYNIIDKTKENELDICIKNKYLFKFLLNNWLGMDKDKIDNEMIEILDIYSIVICKKVSFPWEYTEIEKKYYFMLPHFYFNKMQSKCNLRRVKKNGINKSKKEIECFNVLKKEFEDLVIQHKIPDTKYHCDYYSPKYNLIIEFLGDKFHGNLEIYPAKKIDKMLKKTYEEINKETFTRLDIIHKKGYNIKYIWENDWNKYSAGKYDDIKTILKKY